MPDHYKEIVLTLLVGTLIMFALVGILVFIILYYQRKRFQHSRQILEMEKTYEHTLLESKLEIQEETFKNISQEIHDNIGQVLSFVKLNLNTLNLHGDEQDVEKLLQSRRLLTQAIQDLRDIARTLHTDLIRDMGFPDAVDQQVALLSKSGQYKTHFQVEGIPYRMDGQKELVVFRVLQELLNNIIKHAGATRIWVNVVYETQKLVIQIRDDGSGFDLEEGELAQHKGMGLRNMLNRMSTVGGLIWIHRIPGDGTRATIELPNTTI